MTDPYTGLVSGETNMGKGLIASKTFWVNAITAVVGIATYFQGSDLIAAHPEAVAIIGTIVGVLNVILRIVTKDPISGVK